MVPIYYESRIAKLALNAAELPKREAEFEESIPQSRDEEEMEFQQKMMTKWAALEALVGDPKRIALPRRVAGGVGIRPLRTTKCGSRV